MAEPPAVGGTLGARLAGSYGVALGDYMAAMAADLRRVSRSVRT